MYLRIPFTARAIFTEYDRRNPPFWSLWRDGVALCAQLGRLHVVTDNDPTNRDNPVLW